jgi:hypothetical protein
LQSSPRPQQSDQAAPDQPAKIAHRANFSRFGGPSQPFGVCDRDRKFMDSLLAQFIDVKRSASSPGPTGTTSW